MAGPRHTGQGARADRILDAAKDLLLRWGYRRVTIDEIAKHAGVGKGTVYLHWRTREQLFLAVGAREAVEMIEAVLAAMRADPTQITLHRYMRRFFVEAMRRPVLRAIFTRDDETLGKFLSSPSRRPLESAKLVASREYLGVLIEHGLLRAGLRPEDLDYSLPTIVFGFFAIEPLLPPGTALGLEDKADHLADTLRRTFEPAAPPSTADLATAAAKVIEIFERLAREYRDAARGITGE
ncbi:TetR/AcrR family transcriptional regulator [Streptosporangium minutum]|uniref:TetR family transcriptional regulator n=1 Tax=Streptosporangium minutum TaxID=569862 RepID=A0A243RHC9_9ACTN|nr:TetR/AcrR family transcriptional regulator [Streptosporangium minutum]OUC94210.1 TetR family transcriptional regulator [Streptosporangium minutum]